MRKLVSLIALALLGSIQCVTSVRGQAYPSLQELTKTYSAIASGAQLSRDDLIAILKRVRNRDLAQLNESSPLFDLILQTENNSRRLQKFAVTDQDVADFSNRELGAEGIVIPNEITAGAIHRYRIFLSHLYPGLIMQNARGIDVSMNFGILEAIVVADLVCSMGGPPSVTQNLREVSEDLGGRELSNHPRPQQVASLSGARRNYWKTRNEQLRVVDFQSLVEKHFAKSTVR